MVADRRCCFLDDIAERGGVQRDGSGIECDCGGFVGQHGDNPGWG